MPWALVLVALVALFMWRGSSAVNVRAFLALIRQAESNDRYDVIAGGDTFDDFDEHPFVLDPYRRKPLGTTASGAYQMVVHTWLLARDALALPDFSPANQDRAAEFLLAHKVPGHNVIKPEGTGTLELVQAGRFDDAIAVLGPEWESFAKMTAGTYHITLGEARAFIEAKGGTYAREVA